MLLRIEKATRCEDKASIKIGKYEIFIMNVVKVVLEKCNTDDKQNESLGQFNDGVQVPSFLVGYVDMSEENPHTNILTSWSQLGELIFDMNPSDSKVFENYLTDNAIKTLHLEILHTINGMLIVSQHLQYLAKDTDITWEQVEEQAKLSKDTQIAMSSIGAGSLLGAAIKTGTDMFNYKNMNSKVKDIADVIASMRFINDNGDISPITLTGVDNVLTQVKDHLNVMP